MNKDRSVDMKKNYVSVELELEDLLIEDVMTISESDMESEMADGGDAF